MPTTVENVNILGNMGKNQNTWFIIDYYQIIEIFSKLKYNLYSLNCTKYLNLFYRIELEFKIKLNFTEYFIFYISSRRIKF